MPTHSTVMAYKMMYVKGGDASVMAPSRTVCALDGGHDSIIL